MAQSTAARLAADPHRPRYHFLPAANWMNDPNGPIYWNGQYHMFYQYNPNGAFWGTMHWGHAVSADMVRWRHLPVALAPTPGSADKDGVFSGCAVNNGGVATLLYTGTQPEVQCMATSRDPDLRVWTKRRAPVIAAPPRDLQVTGFRDPCVWREGEVWYMALGSGFPQVGGAVLLYRSRDLADWEYLHPIHTGRMDTAVFSKSVVATGEMWECPSLFPLGDKHVLFVSTQGTTPFFVGTYKDFRFTPEAEGRLDHGAYYAPITQIDARGNRILWGWITERRPVATQKAAGWSGVLSLPRVLALRGGRLSMEPAAACRTLRGRPQQFVNLYVPDGRPQPVEGVEGDALEIVAEMSGRANELGLRVYDDVPIVYNRARQRLSVGAAKSSLDGNLTLAPNEPLRLDVFLDASVIEVFANGRLCVTERVYTRPGMRLGVAVTASGGPARVQSLTAYEMKPISNDRMTS